MPVRTAYVGTEAVGDVLTKANFDKLPGGWIGYAEVTANQGSITAEVDLTSLTVTVTVNTSRRIKITGRCYMSNTGVAGTNVLKIYEDGGQIQEAGTGALTVAQTIHCEAVRTPSAGSHTYKLRGQATAGTATMVAAATIPAFIMVEDLGPAS